MSRLFKTGVSLTIARPQSFFSQSPNAIVIRDLHIIADIDKHLGKDPNNCDLVVINLSEKTRGELQQKPLYIRLEAGFDGSLERVFEGDMRWCESVKDGTSWVTKIQVGDGDRAFRFAQVSQSYRAGTPVRNVVFDLLSAMGAPFDRVNLLADMTATVASGIVVDGLISKELTRLLRPFQKQWSIQDGTVQILGEGELRKDQVAVISSLPGSNSGMIGSPEYGSPPEKGKPPILTVKNLLYPRLVPGGTMEVRSRYIHGRFKVLKLRHTIDTHGTDCHTQIDGNPL